MRLVSKLVSFCLFASAINEKVFQSKKESTYTGTEERKIQEAQLGIEPRASRFAHQCSNH